MAVSQSFSSSSSSPEVVLDGYEDLLSTFHTLLTTYPPPFIFVHDPTTPRISASILHNFLSELQLPQSGAEHPSSETDPPKQRTKIYVAHIDAIAIYTPRLFYDTVLNQLAGWSPKWDEGCRNWCGGDGEQRYNESFDAFLHGLMALERSFVSERNAVDGTQFWAGRADAKDKANGKGEKLAMNTNIEMDHDNHPYRLVLSIHHADRLKDRMPDLLVPLTRLAELVRTPLAPVIVSEVWTHV